MNSTSSPATVPAALTPYPSAWLAWGTMVLLSGAQIMSFVDRFVLSLLITPIKESLLLTDFQIGLLLGPAFAICFAVFGVPIGWLADRKSRTYIVAAGITVWSAMTATCGLAKSFTALFAARIGVGLGEASLNPCVVSLVADCFPRDKRARAIGLYMTSAFIGAGAAYIVGGQAVRIISDLPPLVLPGFGELMAWQTVFLVVAAPGFVIALLLLLIPEPARKGGGGKTPDPQSFLQAVRYFRDFWRAYTSVFIGAAGTTAISAASFWTPALFERTYGWDVDRTGLVIGIVVLAAGIPGANVGGWLSDRFTKRRADGPLVTCLIGSVLMFPGFVLFPLMPSAELSALVLWSAFFGLAVCVGVTPTAVAAITPAGLRAQAAGWFFMTINLLGLFFGPPLVGLVADLLDTPDGLGIALVFTSLFIGAGTVAVFWWGIPAYKAAAKFAAEQES